jgi:hypothetical protein
MSVWIGCNNGWLTTKVAELSFQNVQYLENNAKCEAEQCSKSNFGKEEFTSCELNYISVPLSLLRYQQMRPVSKGKAIPLQALTGPECSRRLKLPDCKTITT